MRWCCRFAPGARAIATWTDVAPPLDPRDVASSEELHDALAAVHERWILELPATLEDPNRAGAWERTATATGWLRLDPDAARRRPSHAAPPDGPLRRRALGAAGARAPTRATVAARCGSCSSTRATSARTSSDRASWRRPCARACAGQTGVQARFAGLAPMGRWATLLASRPVAAACAGGSGLPLAALASGPVAARPRARCGGELRACPADAVHVHSQSVALAMGDAMRRLPVALSVDTTVGDWSRMPAWRPPHRLRAGPDRTEPRRSSAAPSEGPRSSSPGPRGRGVPSSGPRPRRASSSITPGSTCSATARRRAGSAASPGSCSSAGASPRRAARTCSGRSASSSAAPSSSTS